MHEGGSDGKLMVDWDSVLYQDNCVLPILPPTAVRLASKLIVPSCYAASDTCINYLTQQVNDRRKIDSRIAIEFEVICVSEVLTDSLFL